MSVKAGLGACTVTGKTCKFRIARRKGNRVRYQCPDCLRFTKTENRNK